MCVCPEMAFKAKLADFFLFFLMYTNIPAKIDVPVSETAACFCNMLLLQLFCFHELQYQRFPYSTSSTSHFKVYNFWVTLLDFDGFSK